MPLMVFTIHSRMTDVSELSFDAVWQYLQHPFTNIILSSMHIVSCTH